MTVIIPVHDSDSSPENREGSADQESVPAIPDQVRVAILVGRWMVEQSLTIHTPLFVLMEKLPLRIQEMMSIEGLNVDFSENAVYSLGYEGQKPFQRSQTLSESGVTDGDILVLAEVSSDEVFARPIEDVADAVSEYNAVKFPDITAPTVQALTLTVAVGFAVVFSACLVAAWMAAPNRSWWPLGASAVTLFQVAGSVVALRRGAHRPLSYVLGIGAVCTAFVFGWVTVPAVHHVAGHWSAANMLAASGCAALVSLLVWWLTRIGAAVHTGLVTAGGGAAVAAAVMTYTAFTGQQVGAVAALVGVVVVLRAPASALWLARVQSPSLPPPGENLDRDELDESGMQVEVFDDGSEVGRSVELTHTANTELEQKARLANKIVTGLWMAGLAIMVTGTVAANTSAHRYLIHSAVLALVLAASLVLRARTLPDRVCAIAFYVAAFAMTDGCVVAVAIGHPDPRLHAGILAAMFALAVAVVVAGLRLPDVKLSDSTRHKIQRIELLLLMVPAWLVFWISGIYGYARNFFGA